MISSLYQFLRYGQAPALITMLFFTLTATITVAAPSHPISIAAPHCKALIESLSRKNTDRVPDMGFVIGARWQAMTLQERMDTSEAVVGLIRAELPENYISEVFAENFTGCNLNFHISILPDISNSRSGMHDFPRLPRYSATAITSVPSGTASSPLTLTYILEKDGNYIWQIKDLIVNKTPIAATYKRRFNGILAQQGVRGLLKQLESHP